MLEDAGSGVTILSRPPALSIAEAAKRVGLSTHTVCYYERDGLVLRAVDTQRCAGRATAKVERLALLQAHRARVPALLAEVTDQLALAWVLAQADDIAPIPGTKRVRYLEENMGAAAVELTPDDLAAIDAAVPSGPVAGARYGDTSSIDR